MNLIDTHSHIYDEAFSEDISEVIERAKENGVQKILLPNIDADSIPKMHQLVTAYPNYCVPMMGLHPTSVTANYQEDLALCREWLLKPDYKYCAIGEIGIDLYWDKTYKKEQQQVFYTQMKWALVFNLPIVIHAREAFNEIFEILEEFQDTNLKGVFHSFTGNVEQAKKVIDFGFLLGINGIVTFKNAGLDKTIAQVPLDKLMVETDAPYLAPVPKRGKRNESAFVVYTAQKLADIYNVSLQQVADTTNKNAKILFANL